MNVLKLNHKILVLYGLTRRLDSNRTQDQQSLYIFHLFQNQCFVCMLYQFTLCVIEHDFSTPRLYIIDNLPVDLSFSSILLRHSTVACPVLFDDY